MEYLKIIQYWKIQYVHRQIEEETKIIHIRLIDSRHACE